MEKSVRTTRIGLRSSSPTITLAIRTRAPANRGSRCSAGRRSIWSDLPAWVLCDAPGASRDVRSCRRLPEPWIVKPLANLHCSDSAGVVVERVDEDDGIFRYDRRRYLQNGGAKLLKP